MRRNFVPRTDLALESYDSSDKKLPEGVFCQQQTIENVLKTTVRIDTEQAAKRLKRPRGRYITLEGDMSVAAETMTDELQKELAAMLPDGPVLVVGLGNRDITPDVIGPAAADKIMATRHLFSEQLERMGLKELRSVCVLSPGVMGQTGLEVFELISALLQRHEFRSVIAIDALAARSAARLGKTVQLCDSGISPGSGVLNRRAELSSSTLGIPVIAIGVPTVVDSAALIYELCPQCQCGDMAMMMVTPREIDEVARQAAAVSARAVNRALQPFLTDEEIDIFTS